MSETELDNPPTGLRLIPAMELPAATTSDLLNQLPTVIREILEATAARHGNAQRDWLVVDGRKGLESRPRTLEQLAGAIGVRSRERPRQVADKALGRIRDTFASGYEGPGFKLRPETAAALEDLYGCGPSAIKPLVTEEELMACLGQEPRETSEERLRRLCFLFEIRGVVRFEPNGERRQAVWYLGTRENGAAIIDLVDRIDQLLCSQVLDPVTELDLVVELNTARPGEMVTIEEVRAATSLCHTIERMEDGRLRGRFEWLTGRGNQVYRLVYDAGTPLTADAMVRAINSRSLARMARIDRQNLVNQMIDDPRLIPIGKSGEWGIKSLHDDGAKTIVEHMIDYLSRRGSPDTESAILSAVSAKRPVAKNSIGVYLSAKDNFVRLSDKTWALASWEEAKQAPKRPRRVMRRAAPTLRDHVANEVYATLVARPLREMPLAELVDQLVTAFRRPRVTFYSYVAGLPYVEKVRVENVSFVRLKASVAKPGVALTPGEVRAMIAAGESQIVEFKSSFRWDVERGQENRSLQKACTKSIAAFLNGSGGHLIVGVEDNRNLFGIEKDLDLLASVGQGGTDGFSQAFANVVASHLGPELGALLTFQYVVLDGKTLYVVGVRQSPRPVYLTEAGKQQLYVRLETTTQPLSDEQANEYIALWWPDAGGLAR